MRRFPDKQVRTLSDHAKKARRIRLATRGSLGNPSSCNRFGEIPADLSHTGRLPVEELVRGMEPARLNAELRRRLHLSQQSFAPVNLMVATDPDQHLRTFLCRTSSGDTATVAICNLPFAPADGDG
jgi:hypothetical protein